MSTGKGINTVEIDGQVVHITDLSPEQLCDQWAKRQRELNDLYEVNRKANSGWRGFILGLIGIRLPDKNVYFLGGRSSTGESLYSHHAQRGKTSEGMSEPPCKS